LYVCSVSIVESRLRRTRHMTATWDERTPRPHHQRRSHAVSADAALHTPTSLSTISAHTAVSTSCLSLFIMMFLKQLNPAFQ